MPYWEVFTPVGAYTDDQRQALAKAITKACIAFTGIPAFFVNVRYQEMPESTIYLGGEPTKNFVRIVTDTIAHEMPTSEERAACMEAIEDAIAPHIKDRGFDWEIHLDETPIELWRVNGLVAPVNHPELFAQWVKENRPIPWEVPV
ncbi:tautomerase family protein [Microbacterium karelineae]|uniref:tautomerase family protein n=1 Tax=Microbacterium karelineae TaxID=2654283 RepID=UPI0012E9E316|nr:tautomerase family protein [Microbacterium karelineae]